MWQAAPQRMLRLLLVAAAALLQAGRARLVYEPDADFFGADEITVAVLTDADIHNASTVLSVVVAPVDDAATLDASGVAIAEAGGPPVCVLEDANVTDADGSDALVSLVINADRGDVALAPTAADLAGARVVLEAPLTLEATPARLTALLRRCGVTYLPPTTPGPDEVTAAVDGGPLSTVEVVVLKASAPTLLGCGSSLDVAEGASRAVPLVITGGVDDAPFLKLEWSSDAVVSILNGTDSVLSVATPRSIVLSSPAALRRMVANGLLVYRASRRGTDAVLFRLTGLDGINGTDGETSEATCSIQVAPTNAAPAFLGPLDRGDGSRHWRGREDTLISIRGIVIVDADADEVSVVLEATPAGRLLLAARPVGILIETREGDGAWPANSSKLTLRGGVDSINRALDGLRFMPPRDFSGAAGVRLHVTDEHGASDEAVAGIEVEEVRDAPAFAPGAAVSAEDGAVHAREDEPVRLGGAVRAGIGAVGGRGPVATLAAHDFGDADGILTITTDAPITALLLNDEKWRSHGVAVMEGNELRLSGTVAALSAALADVELAPRANWHGHARLSLNLSAADEVLASTEIELFVEAVQDAPRLTSGGPYTVKEDAWLPLSITLIDPDYDDVGDAAAPTVACTLRAAARRGFLRIRGGAAFAAASGSLLEASDGVLLTGPPEAITRTLAQLEYVSAPDAHGDDVVDVVADDGGGFPCETECKGLITSLEIDVRVEAIDDAPRISAPALVHYDEASKGVALGRNGTKLETPVRGVSVYDPDSDVVSVTLTASGGRVKFVSVQDVEHDAEAASASGYARSLTLRANQSALNAALSTLTWVPDDQVAERDGNIAGRLSVEASDGVLTNSTSISIRAAAFNDPPVIVGDTNDVYMEEDGAWTPLPSLDASDADDRQITLRVAARAEGALEVHAIKTEAPLTSRTGAVHVLRVVNASRSNALNASRVERGAFRVTVDLTGIAGLPEGAATRATTEPIAFDAVARIDDERTGSAGERLREGDGVNGDLSHQSVEAKIASLPNFKKAGLKVSVTREDYAAFGSQNYDRYDSLGGARYADDYEVAGHQKRSHKASRGSRFSRPAPVRGGHEWRVTFEGSTPKAASAPLLIHPDATIWDGLVPTAERARPTNSLGGHFLVEVAGHSVEVDHDATHVDMERALGSLPPISAVLVSRSAEGATGGFEWRVTFFEARVDLRVDGTMLRGEHAAVSSELVRARVGAPALYAIEVTHDAHDSVHALSLKRERNFVRIGLDTRNCSVFSGGTGGEGSLRFTPPIPRVAVGNVWEEVDGKRPNANGTFEPAYPPHSLPGPGTSVEAHLMELPNWADLGDASLKVSKHDASGTTVWRVTFSHAPHALPLLRVEAVEGNDDRSLDVLELHDVEEDTWTTSNTSITKGKSLAEQAGLKSRVARTASAALEREASQLRGTWRLKWGDDKTWSPPLDVAATAQEVQAALMNLPGLMLPTAALSARFVVARVRHALGGATYWVAFERDPYEGHDLHADPSLLRGPSTKRCRVRRVRRAAAPGTLRIKAVSSLMRIAGDPYDGDHAFAVAGTPQAIAAALKTWQFKPSLNYYGRAAVDVAVADARGAAAHAGVGVVVHGVEDAPTILFRGEEIGVAGTGSDAYALSVDEDAEARLSGLAVTDVDATPGAVFQVTLTIGHGTLAVHQTAIDALYGAEANWTEIERRGGVRDANRGTATHPGLRNKVREPRTAQRIMHPQAASSLTGTLNLNGSLATINSALSTLSYVGDADWHGVDTVAVTATDGFNSTIAELLVRVRPVNDFPEWTVRSAPRDAIKAPHPDHAPTSGRGTSVLYGRYDQALHSHDASSVYRRNNASLNTGMCVPQADFESSTTDTPVYHGTCAPKWSSDTCVDIEGCPSEACDGNEHPWCMVNEQQWCYCATHVESVVVPSRHFREDGGCALLGGLAVHDADVAFTHTQRDFSEGAPWPAHLELHLAVDDGVLRLRAGDQSGAAAVLDTQGDSFDNLEVVRGDASNGARELVLRGTLGAVNLALAALCYESDANWNGVDVLRLKATDGGDAAYGSGGRKSAQIKVALHVEGVRDAPQVAAPVFDVDALEDAVVQFGGEATDQIYVNTSFVVQDGDLDDLTLPLRRWLVPASKSLDSITTKSWSGPWREFNRFDANELTQGTFAYVDAEHPTWLGDISSHADAGQVASQKHAFTRTPVRDSYRLTIQARRGGLRLPLSKEDDQTWPHVLDLENYTLFEANRALQNLLYRPDLHWNSQHASKALADVGGAGGNVDDDGALENITVTVYDAQGVGTAASVLFFVHPVNDAPLLDQLQEVKHLEDGTADQLSRLRLSTVTQLVAEDASVTALGLSVRDVDAIDVPGGFVDVALIVHRGTLKLTEKRAVTVQNEGSNMLHVSGKPADVTHALDSLEYAPSLNYAGDDALFVSASDRGNVGKGGELSTLLEVPLFVTSACDAPIVKAIRGVVDAREDDGTGIGFEVSDADHANLRELYGRGAFLQYLYRDAMGYTLNTSATRTAATFEPLIEVTLVAGNGTLTLESRSALTFVQGTGVSDATVTFRSTLHHARAALASIVYEPKRDFFTSPLNGGPAADTVDVIIDDLGKDFGGLPEGLGAPCAALVARASVRIRIEAVNDAPHVQVPGVIYKGLPGGTARASLRRDLDVLRVKPLIVDEDSILELGHLITCDDDGDGDAWSAEGALTISVERGQFHVDCPHETLSVRDAPFATQVQSTSEGWRTGAVRLRVTPEDRDRCLETLRFRSLRDDHSINSTEPRAFLTVAYEDGGYGSVREAGGVRGCPACAPLYGSFEVEPSLYDMKTIPIIIRPVQDPPSIVSPYDDGASVEMAEDQGGYLPGIRVHDPDDPDASYVLRASATRGVVTLGLDAWFRSSLTWDVGDGDADKAIVASGPLSAINAALAGLRYTPPKDMNGLADITIVVEDLTNFGRTDALSIAVRVAPSQTWNDAPILRVPNATRVGTPCLAKPEGVLLRTNRNQQTDYPQCDRRLAVAAFGGFAEDVPRKAFGALRISDADGSRLQVTLVTLRGALRFDEADALGLEITQASKKVEVRGEAELINDAFGHLEYISDKNWYGVDHLNITVSDVRGAEDRATVLLDVARVADAPYVEIREDDEASYMRGTTGATRYVDGAWARAHAFDVTCDEDRRVRLPSLRVRDVDAEANAEVLEAAARGGVYAASAIRNLVGGVQVPQAFEGPKVEQDASLRLDISVRYGKVSLCATRCPGVAFVEAFPDSEAARRTGPVTDADVVREGWPELVAGGRAESGEILQLLDAAPVRREDGVITGTNLKWWRNATLRGTAANLNAALWDMNYWPHLNYNSDTGIKDHLQLSIVDESGSGQAHVVDAAIRVTAVNDRPVVRAARLETVSITNKGETQATGDGLSLVAVDVNDDALVTTEDEALALLDLFTVRDVDSDAALEVTVTTTRGTSAFTKDEADVVFLAPRAWANGTRHYRDVGASTIVFLASEAKANALLASLVFTPHRDWHGKRGAAVQVACNDRGNVGRGGPLEHAQTVKIRVRAANDAPVITSPELGGGYALYLDQSGRGKLEGAAFEDAGRVYRQTRWSLEDVKAYLHDEDTQEYKYPYHQEAHTGYELWTSAPEVGLNDVVDSAYHASGWRSAPVADIKKWGDAPASSHPRSFVHFRDRLFFAAEDDAHGAELWSTDGSITALNADLLPGRGSSDPRALTVYEDLLYFSAAGHAADEWRVKEDSMAHPGGTRDECDSMRRASFDSTIAFVVSASNVWDPGAQYDCPQGWRWMDSHEAQRTFTGRNYGPSHGGKDENPSKSRHDLATTEELVYYSQCGWTAYEYEGLQRDHFRFSDSHDTGLYKFAGSPDSRRPDVDLVKGGWRGIALNVKRFAGIVCVADPESYDVAPTGRELWVSDGSPQGTLRAAIVHKGASNAWSDPRYLCVFDGALFFGADDGEHGRELHRFSKETQDGRGVSRLVADVRRGADSSDPKYLMSCGNVLWFVANDGLRGEELYASDGGLGYLHRDAGDGANGDVLYPNRGASGTRLAKDIRPGLQSSSPDHFVCLSGVLLFAATDNDKGRELWKASWTDLSDSTTLLVQRVSDIKLGPGSSAPEYLAVLGSRVYFSADDGRVGRELWKTDGSPSGTRLVADARLGSRGSSPMYMTRFLDKLFYVARSADPTDGARRSLEAPTATRLWVTDGSRANTQPVADETGAYMDVDRGALDQAWPRTLATLGNALYYPGRRGATQLDGGLTAGQANRRKRRPQAFAVHDADDDILTLVLDVVPPEAGGLSLDVATPPSVEMLHSDGTRDPTQTFRGTSAHLNLLLADLWFAAAPQYSGAVEIRATVRDDPLRCVANVTDGCERGTNATAAAVLRVFVRRHNQAPFVHVIQGPVGAASDANHIEGFAEVGDPDADGADLGVDASTGLPIEPRLVVTVTAQKGLVSLETRDARLSFIEGTGIEDRRVVVDASVAALNDALSVLTYACAGCALGTADEITVEVDDGGFAGLGGALTASGKVAVTIVGR